MVKSPLHENPIFLMVIVSKVKIFGRDATALTVDTRTKLPNLKAFTNKHKTTRGLGLNDPHLCVKTGAWDPILDKLKD